MAVEVRFITTNVRIDAIEAKVEGGWATAGLGQKYGSGYGLEVKARWMSVIVSNH